MYTLDFDEKWHEYFDRLDKVIKERVRKKIRLLKHSLEGRHLKFGVNCFVLEIGQHRVCYKIDEQKKVKFILFVGDHKEYEKWIGIR